jgi:hypothetical protein
MKFPGTESLGLGKLKKLAFDEIDGESMSILKVNPKIFCENFSDPTVNSGSPNVYSA